MRIETAHCPVVGAAVPRVVDFEGVVDHVICPHYQPSTRKCRAKQAVAAGGPLSRLLQRVDEQTVAEHSAICSLS